MVRIKREIEVISPGTQYGNITGVLNNIIKPIEESSLGDLKDVNIIGIKENDVLTYNEEEWVNVPVYEVTDKYEWNVDGQNANKVNSNADNEEG